MLPSQFVVLVLTLFTSVCQTAPVSSEDELNGLVPSTRAAAEHGPQIFNTIFDSLRKYGTAVHPNGMSFFIATVPEGVLLHHGNHRNSSPTSLEWIAYEIEHAEIFARTHAKRKKSAIVGASMLEGGAFQAILGGGSLSEDSENEHGWLHTYRTERPLHFLLIDGMSGNKDDTGVIDSQDYILRDQSPSDDGNDRSSFSSKNDEPRFRRPPGPRGEFERAQDLCKLCDELQLQGVIRTETPGSEIIKCNFTDGLVELQSLQRMDLGQRGELAHAAGHEGPWRRPGERPGENLPYDFEGCFHDIGSSRTVLDHSTMVSAFFFGVNFTNPNEDEADLPRLVYTSAEERAAIRSYVRQSLAQHKHKSTQESAISWRDIADLVVRRYATRLMLMANSSSVTTLTELAENVESLLNVFVDYSVEDEEERGAAARQRCATFYLRTAPRATQSDEFIYAGFKATNTRICESLFDIQTTLQQNSLGESKVLSDAKASLQQLIGYLGWSVFEEFRLNLTQDAI